MSTHKDCGEQITWVRREDNSGWFPPLEFDGYALVIEDIPDTGEKFAKNVATYKVHHCDPDKVIAWLEYKQRLEEIAAARGESSPYSEGKPDWVIAREKRREELWEKALKYECTDCGAGPGEYCVSRAKGPAIGKRILNPHNARLELVEQEELNGNPS